MLVAVDLSIVVVAVPHAAADAVSSAYDDGYCRCNSHQMMPRLGWLPSLDVENRMTWCVISIILINSVYILKSIGNLCISCAQNRYEQFQFKSKASQSSNMISLAAFTSDY
jgi:hypothetical protein